MTQLTLSRVGVTLHRRQLLADVSLTWPAAQIGGIIGPNGSGKSTLLKAINRILPCSGNISYFDRPLDLKTSRISYVPQLNRSDSALSTFEMVLLGTVRQLGWRVSAAQTDAVEQAMAECGISALADRPFNRLSGGQRQLVMLAQAFVAQPQIILLDEPTSTLDIHHQLRVLNQIADYSRRHRCITLLVIHDLGLALRYCHSLTLLEHGRVVCHGETHMMMWHPMISRTFGVDIESGVSPQGYHYLLPKRFYFHREKIHVHSDKSGHAGSTRRLATGNLPDSPLCYARLAAFLPARKSLQPPTDL